MIEKALRFKAHATEADEGREGNDWARVTRTDLSLRGCGSVNNIKNRLAVQMQTDG